MKKISAIVIAKNEEEMIRECLESITFCDEIILVDNYSTDRTVNIAKHLSAKIIQDSSDDYSYLRNLGLSHSKYPWVFYIDADERVSKDLAKEIKSVLSQENGVSGYKILRKNYYLGDHGWPYIEKLERLFKKSSLIKWQGVLHETPLYNGDLGQLKNFLLHFTHRDLASMVEKTNNWSSTEAGLRLKVRHPNVTWWRFPRVMFGAFYNSYITQKGWKIGTPGLVESIYQAFSIFITYAKLWEMQQNLEGEKKDEKN